MILVTSHPVLRRLGNLEIISTTISLKDNLIRIRKGTRFPTVPLRQTAEATSATLGGRTNRPGEQLQVAHVKFGAIPTFGICIKSYRNMGMRKRKLSRLWKNGHIWTISSRPSNSYCDEVTQKLLNVHFAPDSNKIG